MKKWHTVVLALTPITLLILILTVDLTNLPSFERTDKYEEAVKALIESDYYAYKMSYDLAFDNREDIYRVRDQVKVERTDALVEHHEISIRLTSEDNSEPQLLTYYEAPDYFSGVVASSSLIDDWILMEPRPYFNLYMPTTERMMAILSHFDPKADPIRKDDTYVVYRLEEVTSDAEAYIKGFLEAYGEERDLLENVYKEAYYLDIAFERSTGQIAGIDLLNSSIGKAISSQNGFFENELSGEGKGRFIRKVKEIDYRISGITLEGDPIELPTYLTMEEFIKKTRP